MLDVNNGDFSRRTRKGYVVRLKRWWCWWWYGGGGGGRYYRQLWKRVWKNVHDTSARSLSRLLQGAFEFSTFQYPCNYVFTKNFYKNEPCITGSALKGCHHILIVRNWVELIKRHEMFNLLLNILYTRILF